MLDLIYAILVFSRTYQENKSGRLDFFVCFVRALRRFQQSFSQIATVSSCDRELNAHF